jgi:glycogen operon protein
VRTLAAVRRAHPSFRRRAFLKSEEAIWLRPLARGEASTELPVMRGEDWADPPHAALGLLLRGAGPGCDPGDDDFILLSNADPLPVVFVLPPASWRVLADTQLSAVAGARAPTEMPDGARLFSLSVEAGGLVLLARQSSS